MARSENKNLQTVTLASGDNFIEIFDLTQFSGASCQLVGPGAGAGTMQFQFSNDGQNWFDSSVAAKALAAGKCFIQESFLFCGRLRVKINLSAGAGDYAIMALAKEL